MKISGDLFFLRNLRAISYGAVVGSVSAGSAEIFRLRREDLYDNLVYILYLCSLIGLYPRSTTLSTEEAVARAGLGKVV